MLDSKQPMEDRYLWIAPLLQVLFFLFFFLQWVFF
jgi:hypothetical protein